jgi:hypothetical protein
MYSSTSNIKFSTLVPIFILVLVTHVGTKFSSTKFGRVYTPLGQTAPIPVGTQQVPYGRVYTHIMHDGTAVYAGTDTRDIRYPSSCVHTVPTKFSTFKSTKFSRYTERLCYLVFRSIYTSIWL